MNNRSNGFKRYYKGEGERLPKILTSEKEDPANYHPSEELIAAVNVALTLGMPLFITGEPGLGKSSLAASLAHSLKLKPPLTLVVKSDTTAKDLFYSIDVVARFGEAHGGRAADPRPFMRFEALGEAILRALPAELTAPLAAAREEGFPTEQEQTVVLIDEIDKAPREVPNDLLVEIDQLKFRVPELATWKDKDNAELPSEFQVTDAFAEYRPLIIITSNSEQSLPPAFLRRCVFHHLDMPAYSSKDATQVTVESIVMSRMGDRWKRGYPALQQLLDAFQCLREGQLTLPPTLAEFLALLKFLSSDYDPGLDCSQWTPDALNRAFLGCLVNDKNDRPKAQALLDEFWKKTIR